MNKLFGLAALIACLHSTLSFAFSDIQENQLNKQSLDAIPANSVITIPGPIVAEANTLGTTVIESPKMDCWIEFPRSPNRLVASHGLRMVIKSAWTSSQEADLSGDSVPSSVTELKCSGRDMTIGDLRSALARVGGSLALPPAAEMP